MIMKDSMINKMLIKLIDDFLEVAKKGCSSWSALDFEGCGKDENLNAYWDYKERPPCWSANVNDSIDPLSLLLVAEQPERDLRATRDDVEAINTLCLHLDRSATWVRSFQFGWFGDSNKGQSISGYITGRDLRLRYMK